MVYFPGSTIGNFGPTAARRLLAGMARLVGPGGAVLIGVDLKKDPQVLHAAYNDAAGVTAAFNRNLLVRINRELGGTFRPDRFDHHAFYNPVIGRIEMHLVSRRRQTVRIAGRIDRVCRRREHPDRVLVQVHCPRIPGAGRRRRPAGSASLDRSEALVQRAVPQRCRARTATN